ncbi:YraN family protein [Kaarinaea lacus]
MDWLFGLKDTSTAIGQRAEDTALNFLQAKGMRLVERNYRCKLGEIDLVMRHNDELVFIEVRYRRQNSFGDGAESVDFRKQQRIIKSAEHFLQHHRQYAQTPCRIDVISISQRSAAADEQAAIQWITNAIQA